MTGVLGVDPTRLLAIIDLQNEIATARMSLETVMKAVVDRAGVLTKASGTVVELADGEDMVYRAVGGRAAGSLGVRLMRSSSLSGLCVAEGRPLRCDDAEADPRVDRAACRRVGVKSMICVPLFHSGRAVGVLKVFSDNVSAFSDEDLTTLQYLARIIASSMAQAQDYEEAIRQSLQDGLTGLLNRRSFDARLAEELLRQRRYARPLTLIMMDLDGFKALNDRRGHAAGDDALRQFADILKNSVRTTDACYRFGGDEFAVLLPETGLPEAGIVLQRIRSAVTACGLGFGMVSVSAGAAEAEAHSALELIGAADSALYEEKRCKKSMRSTSQRTVSTETSPVMATR